MFILLIGPKGSGKTHIGRVLQDAWDVHFFPVERYWKAYHEECVRQGREQAIQDGISIVHPEIGRALRRHRHVCVETTGASLEILNSLLSLQDAAPILVRVQAPFEICLERIRRRDPEDQIPIRDELIAEIYQRSQAIDLAFDLELDNSTSLTDRQILDAFTPLITD